MNANRLLILLNGLLAFVVIPIQAITTLVLGIGVSVTFGLLLLPISLCWMVFYLPLLALSWVCNKAPLLREPIGFLLLPWAVISYIFVALMPSMGELENRASKLMLCESWPFTWECSRYFSHDLDLGSPQALAMQEVLHRISDGDPLKQRVLMRVRASEPLDADV